MIPFNGLNLPEVVVCFHIVVCLMVFNTTFNNISVIVDPEKTTLSHNVVTARSARDFELTTSLVVGSDYHTLVPACYAPNQSP